MNALGALTKKLLSVSEMVRFEIQLSTGEKRADGSADPLDLRQGTTVDIRTTVLKETLTAYPAVSYIYRRMKPKNPGRNAGYRVSQSCVFVTNPLGTQQLTTLLC